MRKTLIGFALALVVVVAIVGVVIGTGLYNVAADDEHTAFVHELLETTRERSVAARASRIEVPDLSDSERILRGAGNYDSMCADCHLAPGAQDTELNRGLNPKPPNLAIVQGFNPARAFWVIKHGIKSTGMPAWGKSMEDQYIWDMVAFLQQMPGMSSEQYVESVRESEGHSHGGNQSNDEHGHDDDGKSSSSGGEHPREDSEEERKTAPHEHSHHENAGAHTH